MITIIYKTSFMPYTEHCFPAIFSTCNLQIANFDLISGVFHEFDDAMGAQPEEISKIQQLDRQCSNALWSAKGMTEHRRHHSHPLQPRKSPSCDNYLYHWIPVSVAEGLGLPPCHGPSTMISFTSRLCCTLSSISVPTF